MKKVVIILSVVTVLSIGLLIATNMFYNKQKEDNLKLQQDISGLREQNATQESSNKTKELELENLKETKTEELTELNEWNQMKEKLEQALQ